MPQTYGMQQKQFFLKLFILCLVLVVGYGICVASGESFCWSAWTLCCGSHAEQVKHMGLVAPQHVGS